MSLLATCCDQFTIYLVDKINCIHSDVLWNWSTEQGYIQGCLSRLVLWDAFQIVRFKDLNRVLGKVKPVSCILALDPPG